MDQSLQILLNICYSVVLQCYIMFEARSDSKASRLIFSPTNITQGGTSQGQITSRHLKALQLSPEIFTAQSKLRTKLNCPFLWPPLPFFRDVLHVHLPGFIQYRIAICHSTKGTALIYMMCRFCLSFCKRQAVLPFQRFNTFDPPGLNNSGGQI